MANFHAEPTKMDGYGYGDDDLDSKFQFGFPVQPPPTGQGQFQGQVPSQVQGQVPGQVFPSQVPSEPKKSMKDWPREKLDNMFTDVNYDLFVAKSFYFCFFAAFGSLFPLIAVYFKQLGMNPAQAGMLIGLRPFVEMVAGPFWGNVAERWKKWKMILLFSLFCWVLFTLSLAFVQPQAHSCLVHNGTNIFVAKPYTISGLKFADMVNQQARRKRSIGSEFAPSSTLQRRSIGSNAAPATISRTGDRELIRSPESIGRVRRALKEVKSTSGSSLVKYYPGDEREDYDEYEELKNSEIPKEYEGDIEEEKDEKIRSKRDADDDDNDGDDKDDSDDEEADDEDEPDIDGNDVKEQQKYFQFRQFPYPAIDIPGLSPVPLNHKHIANLDEVDVQDLVSPPLSAVVYRIRDIRAIFLVLLILQILGEFLSTPAITMADTATLGYLEDDVENYGKQRMYGSLGWAVSMFFVGIALDHSNIFPNHPCGTEHLVDRNYMTCYAVFSVLMCFAFFIATQFRFKEVDAPIQSIPLSRIKDKVMDTVHQKIGNLKRQDQPANGGQVDGGQLGGQDPSRVHISLQDEAGRNMISDTQHHVDEVSADTMAMKPSPYVPRGKPGQAGTLPKWIAVLKMFAPIQFSSMFFILWFMGFGVGLVFAFLFWHLQDLRGSPTLFGISSVINHLSELIAFFFIRNVVAKFGHLNVLYAGLVGNVARFMYISYLENPWWVLPFEFLQGLTHAAVWAAGCSYMTQTIPAENRPTAQMILQSLHHAVGRGCGTIIGGFFINSYGTESVFRGYGITCIFVFVGYFALNFFYISKLPPILGAPPITNDLPAESTYLTPHGVPGGAIAKSQSNSRLDKGPNSDASQFNCGGGMGGSSAGNNFTYQTGPTFQSDPYASDDRSAQGIYRPGAEGGGAYQPGMGGGGAYQPGSGGGGGNYQYNYSTEQSAHSGDSALGTRLQSERPPQNIQPNTNDYYGGAGYGGQAYNGSEGSKVQHRVVLQSAPHPSTEPVHEQPMFESQTYDRWR